MNTKKKIKVLITYIEAGMGHIMTAEAISSALKKYYKEECDVKDLYIYRDTKSKHLKAVEKFLVSQVKLSNKVKGVGDLWFKAMQIGHNPQKLIRIVNNVTFINAKKDMMKLLDELDYDVIVSTHYLTTFFFCEYRKEHPNTKKKFIMYNPDNNVPDVNDNRIELFITNNEYATKYAMNKLHFEPDHVKTVSFICRQELIDCKLDKKQLRKKHRIPQDKFVICLADGGYASANMLYTLRQLVKSKKEMVLLPIAGKNKKAYQSILKIILKGLPENIKIIPYKFVPHAYELYGASDLFITKAGPNAITDCLYMHTPIIANYAAQPIEEYSADLFCNKYKCGKYITERKLIKKQVEDWIDHPSKLKKYYNNTLKFDKDKGGAKDIARIIVEYTKGKLK